MSTLRGNPCYLQPSCNRDATIWSRAFIDRSRDVKFNTQSVTSEDAVNLRRSEGLPSPPRQLFGNHIEPRNGQFSVRLTSTTQPLVCQGSGHDQGAVRLHR